MLEQITRELTIEALPDRHSRASSSTTYPKPVIGDTVTLEAISAPEGVKLVGDPETVIATLTPPKLQLEEEAEIEEETELVARGRGGRGARRRPRAARGPRAIPASSRGRAVMRFARSRRWTRSTG